MASKTLPETVPALDPIDRLISRGVKVRQLVQLSSTAAEWLANHQDDTFRVCYFDAEGAVLSEVVTAVGLIQRADQLGWKPDAEKSPEPHPYLFEDAVYHYRRGVHYYATAIEEESGDCLPLCFPASVISAAKSRHERAIARFNRDAALKQSREEHEKKRQKRINARAAIREMVAARMEEAARNGELITQRKAARMVQDEANELIEIMHRTREKFLRAGPETSA